MSVSERVYQLAEWSIYPDKSAIQRDEELIHLEPKIMEVLVYLVINANRVISREELTEKVWQTKYASDEVITRAISVLRKKLDDTGKVHRFIKTIPKHGYVLETEDIKCIDRDLELNTANRLDSISSRLNHFISPKLAFFMVIFSLFIVISVVAYQYTPIIQSDRTAKAEKISISIDSFVASDNLEPSKMVARVLTEQLMTTLSNSDSAIVKAKQTETNSISEFVISGGVKQVNDEFHISLHFSETKTDNVLWSQSFAGSSGTWHQLINNVSQTIKYFISVAYLDSLDLKNLSLDKLQASVLLHQARELRFTGIEEEYMLAVNILENSYLSFPDDAKLQHELIITHYAIGTLFARNYNIERAKQLLIEAKLANNTHGFYFLLLALIGQFNNELTPQQAIDIALDSKVAIEKSAETLTYLGDLYRLANDYDLAQRYYQNAFRLNSDYALVNLQLARLESQLGNNKQAISRLKSYIGKKPESYNAQLLLANIYIVDSKFSEAIFLIGKLDSHLTKGQVNDLLAQTYFSLGLNAAALLAYNEVNISACSIYIIKQQYKQAKEACLLADQARAPQDKFHYARTLMMLSNFDLAQQRYRHVFEKLEPKISSLNDRLLADLTDYIWVLSKSGMQAQAQDLANKFFNAIENKTRIGYNGYGINDVIVYIAIGDLQSAGDAFNSALEQEWLQYYSLKYGAPHPALNELSNDIRYKQWLIFIDKSLAIQKKEVY